MILGTGRLYEIKADARLSYMKSFHAKLKFHDYTKIKLWNDFEVKLSDCKTGLRNFVVTLNIQVSNSLQWMAKIWDKWKLKGDIILNLLQWLKKPYEAVLVERKNRNILNVALNIVSEATTWKYCEIMFWD